MNSIYKNAAISLANVTTVIFNPDGDKPLSNKYLLDESYPIVIIKLIVGEKQMDYDLFF